MDEREEAGIWKKQCSRNIIERDLFGEVMSFRDNGYVFCNDRICILNCSVFESFEF